MEFFLEMLLTVVLALLFSFLVAMLVSVASAEKPEIICVGDDALSGKNMDIRLAESMRNLSVVDENVELVDRFGNETDPVLEVEEAVTRNAEIRGEREDLVVYTPGGESTAVVSLENNEIAEEMIVLGEEKQSDSAEEFGAEREELMVRTVEAAESSGSVLSENVLAEEIVVLQGQEDRSKSTDLGRSGCVENEESEGDVVVAESAEEEVRVEETNTSVAESDTEGYDEEKEELSIEDDDDDWEGIERSELEKAFAAAANLLEESGKADEIGAEAKTELYGLHKIATEGPCRETQPMAVMVSARAKWNAWQKLGNMSQEEAMEKYIALFSKEVPGLMNAGHTVGKMSEMETSVSLPPISGSLEPRNLDATCVDESIKKGIP